MATSVEQSLKTIRSWMSKHVPLPLHLNPPAQPAEIAQVEAAIGMELPAPFKAFLSIHNGESTGAPSLLGDFNGLLSCQQIIQHYRRDQELSDSADAVECPSFNCWKERVDSETVFIKGPVKPLLFHPKWIPLTNTHSEVHRYIDLDPAPGGTLGQIIEVDPEGFSFEVIAQSFADLLAEHAKRLSLGQFRFDAELGEIVSKRKSDPSTWGMPDWLKKV